MGSSHHGQLQEPSGGLQWDRQKGWEGSRRYLRDTNLKVMTAEVVVWITLLDGKVLAGEEDREMVERIGYGTSAARPYLFAAFGSRSTRTEPGAPLPGRSCAICNREGRRRALGHTMFSRLDE